MYKDGEVIPAWHSVVLGRHADFVGYQAAFRVASLEASIALERDVFPEAKISPRRKRVKLVLVTGAELGIEWETDYIRVMALAHQLGLLRCPVEVALALLEQYEDQSIGEWVTVATDWVRWEKKRYLIQVGRRHTGRTAVLLNDEFGYGPDVRWAFLAPQAVRARG